MRSVRAMRPEMLSRLDAIDRDLYLAVAGTSLAGWDSGLRRLSNAANHSRLWLVIAGGLLLAGQRHRRAALCGVAAIGIASATVNLVVKPVLVRKRPDRVAAGLPLTRHVRMPRSHSFPSGHAASAFAFAFAVGGKLRPAGMPLRALATAVAYSRVHTGVHYPGDVLAGALLGAVTGMAVRALARSRPVCAGSRPSVVSGQCRG